MATFTASPITSPAPTVQYDLPSDLLNAQTIQQNNNALTTQAQQIADMRQEVNLRPGIASGDMNALSQLNAIDPTLATNARTNIVADQQMPYAVATSRIALLGKVSQGLLAVDPADRPAAYQTARAQLGPLGASLPEDYPGDGPTKQMAFAGLNSGDAVNYLKGMIVSGPTSSGGATPAAAPTSGLNALTAYAGAIGSAESGGNPNATSTTSSAVGADQFLAGTWEQELATHRPDLVAGKTQAQILAMRNDPNLSAEITNDYAQDNSSVLGQHSIPITPASLAVAHHFGPQGAVDLYAAENNNPNTPMTSIVSSAVIKANPSLANQTVGTVLGSIRTQMAGVTQPPNTLIASMPTASGPPPAQGASLPPTIAPGSPDDTSSGQGSSSGATTSYTPPVAPGAGTAQPLPASTPTGIPAGITPLLHGDGSPAVAPNQPGYQLGKDAGGNLVSFPMPRGPADPAVVAQQAQTKAAADAGYQIVNGQWVAIPGGPADASVIARNKGAAAQATAAADGPIPGGAAVAPPQQPGGGPFPLPPTDPYAGQNNNAALAKRMNDDRTAANDVVAADAPIIQRNVDSIQQLQQFRQLNSQNTTGPNAENVTNWAARAVAPGWFGSNHDYATMDKITAQQQVSNLPTTFSRIDLPIIKASQAAQVGTNKPRETNESVENTQIAGAQRDIALRTARAQWVQQYGTLSGFQQLWNDYNDHVPTLAWGTSPGSIVVATGQPSFQAWTTARAPGGRYNPALASVPDSQLQGAQQPQQPQPQQGQPPQMQQAASQPQPGTSRRPGAVYHVASAADYASVPAGSQYVSPDGVMRVKQ
ncbi:hypothetical protein ACELLULO517_27370 [Acidisoma cellulosilytica]|uniref:Uncharacterized protein n=1 Tax=Acidisoma cellulosilyticum TaxID=2802395 RepID=A0A963Z6Z9_9PROT|nr:hypothetical protein [Acidisoma cellulosilyticum]MCB8883990.1 hypothetical protein [Acidisoma cellulosilyticum]